MRIVRKQMLIQHIVLILCISFISGCKTPYYVDEIGAVNTYRELTTSALDSDTLSLQTRQYLRLNNLKLNQAPDQLVCDFINSENSTPKKEIATAEILLYKSLKEKNPHRALSGFLITSEITYRFLTTEQDLESDYKISPEYRFMTDIYNRCLTEISNLKTKSYQDKIHNTSISTPYNTVYHLKWQTPTEQMISPDAFDNIRPSNNYQIHGLKNKYFNQGLGSPTIAIVDDPHNNQYWGVNFPKSLFSYPLTLIAEFDEPKIANNQREVDLKLSFYDPLLIDHIKINDKRIPLETDYTTPLVYQLQNIDPVKLGITGLLETQEVIQTSGLFMLEPYRENKIPVVMVHGLMSSPITWTPMFNDLRGDPLIRKNYQFWFFRYPTGLPILYNAGLLRKDLNKLINEVDPQHQNPNISKMVMVGHSMGGLLTRDMLHDSGDIYWYSIFDEPLDCLDVDCQTKQILKDSLFFKRQDYISRVVFISTPHRGSDLADSFLASIGSGLITFPDFINKLNNEIFTDKEALSYKVRNNAKKISTSIELLSPESTYIQTEQTIPLPTDIPMHSIIGIRNAKCACGSSDGIVPYWSSHICEAQSETLVHSNHGAQRNQKTINEVRRILKLHLEEINRTAEKE